MFDISFTIEVAIRLFAAVIVGVLIGSERAKHGRAAGMRTHVLVALGACLTSLMSIFVSDYLGAGGDVMRISAQVISGIGFLGAGMIVIKNNDIITGLTTAAGVWTTSIIGIALGYGFYFGALFGTILFLVAIVLFAKFEKRTKSTEIIYIEVENISNLNSTIKAIEEEIGVSVVFSVVPPKTARQGNVGLLVTVSECIKIDFNKLSNIENVLFALED